jgi:hypothetical protein
MLERVASCGTQKLPQKNIPIVTPKQKNSTFANSNSNYQTLYELSTSITNNQ